MRSKKFSLIAFALIISMLVWMMPLTFADAPKYEKELKIVSGSQSDLTTFTYDGHVVSEGFAVSVSMMAAVEPNERSFSRAASAVSLGSGWSKDLHTYKPRVSEMWVNVTGDSNFRIYTGGIADNTGTGGECTVSWATVLGILEAILPYILDYLREEPPLEEWQPTIPVHWAKAIVRSKVAYEGTRLQPKYNPSVRTAGCDFDSRFLQKGYQYLTVTAGADICLVHGYWSQGDYWVWGTIPIGTYSVTFQVEVPVTNEPETPSTPSGETYGYRNVWYTYSTSTIDPDEDNVRYQFEFSGPIPTISFMTGWYASGQTGSLTVQWEPSDPPGTYQIRVRAQDFYEEWSCWSPYLTVNIVNRAPNTPSTPSGPTSGYTSTSYTYSTSTTDPDGDYVRYQFYWGDGYTTTGWYPSGSTASASHRWSSSGTYYVKVRAQDYYGAWSSWSSSRVVSISSGGGGGGGCPYVYTWNGQRYVIDNSLLSASEISNGADVEDYYKLEQTLVPTYQGSQFSRYSLQIGEFENEHSYFDQVKLIAVDHDSDVNIGVTPDGEILTYREPQTPIFCVDSYGENKLSEILQVDGNVSDPTTYYYGETGDYLVLNFGHVDSEDAKLILRDDMKCMICCIEVQVLDDSGEWQTVSLVAPRDYWATEAVDLSEYVIEDEDLLVRLYWTSPHRLDYVGLDTSPQEKVELHQAQLIRATHSVEGNVKPLLKENDGNYVELTPNQQITLTFLLPNNQNEERTFIFYTEGHYNTIA